MGVLMRPRKFKKKIQRDPDLFLIAETGEKIIGSIIGGFDGRRGLIYHLAISREYRGRGIGTQLMVEIESRLRSKGCLKCYLLVTTDNDEAMQYYESHHWQHMDTVRLYGKELQ